MTAPADAPTKTNPGNFFEDFAVGQVIRHATPRTITAGDVALYTGLTGSRFALASSDAFAQSLGYPSAPIDDLLTFHVVFGKTVPDISLNAVANLGYADLRFAAPVYPGDTLATTSEVIGVKQNSNGKTGVVYVRSTGRNQADAVVLEYVRWVMVNKRDAEAPAPETVLPALPGAVEVAQLADAAAHIPEFQPAAYDDTLAGSPHRWDAYAVGEKIAHIDGMTIEEAEHQIATRLYQNTAKVHFNAHTQSTSRFGKRLIYGGVVISLVRALSFNGLGNAMRILAVNGGRHVNPCFAADTVYAWSEVVAKEAIAGRGDIGALRIRSFGVRDDDCTGAGDLPAHPKPETVPDGNAAVLLDLDYWVALPR